MITPLIFVLLQAPITLEEVRAASRENLDALRAEIELRRQALGVTLARGPIFPQVSLGAQAGVQASTARKVFSPVLVPDPETNMLTQTPVNPANSAGNLALSVTVNQLIYDGGRWWNAIAQAGAQERAAEGQLQEQRLVSELEAVSRFYQLLSAQLTLKVLENAITRSEVQRTRAESLYEAGRGKKLDAIDSAVNLGNDRIAALRQRQAVVAAQVELLKWLGRPTVEIEAVDPNPSGKFPKAPTFERVTSEARENRPLLRALAAQAEAAERQVSVAWSPFLPTVGIGATYQRQSPNADPFFTDITKNNTLIANLNLTWQLFSGFQDQARLDQFRANLSQARLQKERAQIDLDGDLRRTLRALEAQMSVAQVATENLSLAEQGVQLAEERFTAGAGSSLEVRDAQVKLVNAQLSGLQARVDVAVAREGLKRVVGKEVEERQ